MDFGGTFGEYNSYQTRTTVFDGEPPDRFPTIHVIVVEALEAGLHAAAPGMTARELDGVVRNVIDGAGYGEQFVTGTGHGIGLRAHEPPSIDQHDDTTLEAGMAFTIEPGIYLEGAFGVRLETVVLLGEDGAGAINKSTHDWRAC